MNSKNSDNNSLGMVIVIRKGSIERIHFNNIKKDR